MDDDRSDAKRAARDIVVGVWAAMTTPFDADGRMDPRRRGADLTRLVHGRHRQPRALRPRTWPSPRRDRRSPSNGEPVKERFFGPDHHEERHEKRGRTT